jgi:hypothetical protein
MTASSSEPPPDMPVSSLGSASPTDRSAVEVSLRDTLDYLRTMLSELTVIARRQRLDMLAYMLEMAHLEATDALARENAPARGKRARRKADDATSADGATEGDLEK